MIRFEIRAARPLRGRALFQMNRAGLWNAIETRKALLICVENQRFTTLEREHLARLARRSGAVPRCLTVVEHLARIEVHREVETSVGAVEHAAALTIGTQLVGNVDVAERKAHGVEGIGLGLRRENRDEFVAFRVFDALYFGASREQPAVLVVLIDVVV